MFVLTISPNVKTFPVSFLAHTYTAQLLHTVTEDNLPAIQLLCSSHLGQLETVLTSSELPGPEGVGDGQLLLIRTAIAGEYMCIASIYVYRISCCLLLGYRQPNIAR